MDERTASHLVECSPASWSVFAVGSSTVECTATGDAGLVSTGSFTVTVLGAADQLTGLLTAVTGVGPGRSLADTVQSISAAVAAGDTDQACGTLDALLEQVRGQAGKSLSVEVAAAITEDATRIRGVLGCP